MHHIYIIRNKINSKVYVGQTKNPKSRWSKHKFLANHGKNHPLYDSMRKYGIDNFEFNLIEEFDSELDVDNSEDYWIEKLQSRNRQFGYNLALGGNVARGWKHSDCTKKKMSENNLGHQRNNNPETKEKLRQANLGKNYSDETKDRMSQSAKARGSTESQLLALKLSNQNKITSEETKQKLSLSNRKKKGGCSKFLGVYKAGIKWRAMIKLNGKYIHLGCFSTELEAADRYDQEAMIHNFPTNKELN